MARIPNVRWKSLASAHEIAKSLVLENRIKSRISVYRKMSSKLCTLVSHTME